MSILNFDQTSRKKNKKQQVNPVTEKGNNWSVAVFRLPLKNWVNVIRELPSFLKSHKEFLIPHYTIRAYEGNSIIISFRILRNQQDEELVKSTIMDFLKDYEYEIDPIQGNKFYQYHAWISKGQSSSLWTNERCIILNKLSKFVSEIIDSDTTKEERIQWGHLFSNMMTISDFIRIIRSPETSPNLEPLYYCNINNYQVRISIANYLRDLANKLSEN